MKAARLLRISLSWTMVLLVLQPQTILGLANNNNSNNHGTSRRAAFTQLQKIIATNGIAAVAATPSLAISSNDSSASSSSSSSSSSAASAFVGTFSDPINHPGGKRTIRLLPPSETSTAFLSGDYRLAEVVGGGGLGEPKNYVLPAVIFGDRAIVIDFSPKGGPRDFTGVLDGNNGDIRFLTDGNRWPRLSND